LGGPDSLEAVEPFLFNLFSDPDIIDFPFARLGRPMLARLVSRHRARHAREHYAAIGGRSPIRELTDRQARALERQLRGALGLDARVFVAMRYWHPLTEAAVEYVVGGNFSELVLLPLYPHYSKTTTGSSLHEWRRQYDARARHALPTRLVREFYDHPGYLQAVVARINEGLERFSDAPSTTPESPPQSRRGLWGGAVAPVGARLDAAGDRRVGEPSGLPREGETLPSRHGASPALAVSGPQREREALPYQEPPRPSQGTATDDVHLVFSAHGVPVAVIEAGDPYRAQIEETVRLVMARGGWANPHALCWQSRIAPGKWLEPSLQDTLRSLAGRGVKRVLVIPIPFVTDHLETLAEINIGARALAGRLGIEQFEVMPALNDSPTFIHALADLVLAQVGTLTAESS
jgi:protoheme ferro-lyase